MKRRKRPPLLRHLAWRDLQPKLTQLPTSALFISILKATLAISLCMTLTFIFPFVDLCRHPFALHSTIMVVVVGGPGRTLGGCVHNLLLGAMGLAVGVAAFAILEVLGRAGSPVGQGFVFALLMYLVALVRFQGPKWISFYLFSALFAIQGIYTSVDENEDRGQPFSWLLAYFQAYTWGFAIVLAANLAFPDAAESQLRRQLVSSLNHLCTLSHLTCKAFALECSEDEKQVRQHLLRLVRQDFTSLVAKLEDEVSFEINFTRWKVEDYRNMIEKVRAVQLGLITASSAIETIDTLDPNGTNFTKLWGVREDDPKAMKESFRQFRRAVDITITEIIAALDPSASPSTAPSSAPPPSVPSEPEYDPEDHQSTESAETKLPNIASRLRAEVRRSERRRTDNWRQHKHERSTSTGVSPPLSPIFRGISQRAEDTVTSEISIGWSGVLRDLQTTAGTLVAAEQSGELLRKAWETFKEAQLDGLVELIKSEALGVKDELKILEGMPSLMSLYSDRLPETWTSTLAEKPTLKQLGKRTPEKSMGREPHLDFDAEGGSVQLVSEAVTKCYSLLFGFNQLVDELTSIVQLTSELRNQPRRARFHFFERNPLSFFKRKNTTGSLSLQAALAALRGETFVSASTPLLQRALTAERWLRSDRSLYALKVALGATVYSILLLAQGPQEFFVQYSEHFYGAKVDVLSPCLCAALTSSLVTVIVAISPSLGQTLFLFALQLLGTGIGAIFGLISLEIFKNVGGWMYNPFGLTFCMASWGGLSSFFLYKDPRWFSGAFLSINGAGSIIIEEYLYNDVPSSRRAYYSPQLRAGQIIAAMLISISIAFVVQVLTFRSPARRQLRLKIAAVTFKLSSYNTLLQSNINCVAPAEAAPLPPAQAVFDVQNELIRREKEIQADIIALGPLYEFAALEPKWAVPFQGETLLKIINSHQIILDRLREARAGVGSTGFSPSVHRDFVSPLYPYRLHSQRLSRTLFYLGATSLVSKTPLPRDVPSSKATWRGFENDVLVLSRRMSLLPGREKELRYEGFLRYWFYLVAVGAVSRELENLENHLGDLFGVPEESNPWLS
ncbi:hypothetical protein T439DRAFT_1000 [Meredithblackwellia eburnea MCA 4105]